MHELVSSHKAAGYKAAGHKATGAPKRSQKDTGSLAGKMESEMEARPFFANEAPRLFRRSSCACGGGCPACMEKSAKSSGLNISQPGDPAEIEADRIADQVLAGKPVSAANQAASESAPQAQRHADLSGERVESMPETVGRVLSRSGGRMEPSLKDDMEQRFGRDFSQVNMHFGSEAESSARDVGADAYTVGSNIVFGAGKYAPDTAGGKHLIAHELAHVVQQGIPASSSFSNSGHNAGGSGTLFRYRSKGKDTIAFDEPNETLKDPKTQPWIESIDVSFTRAVVDTGHKAAAKAAGQIEPRMPSGTLTAKYSKKSSTVPKDISLSIVGGSTMLGIGLTDRVTDATVQRLEGLGYTDYDNVSKGNLTDPVAKTGKGARYSASGAGTMNYAIFFKGIQAIHEGLLNTGSHACVHVGDHATMKTLNYHSRAGTTKVSVSYDSAVLKDLCCHRKDTGNANWNGNPCEKTKCP
jgi:hypothetical protein